jgi:hypothetical protein
LAVSKSIQILLEEFSAYRHMKKRTFSFYSII